MSATNTHQSYGSISKTFHWLTALLILTLIPLGIIAENLPYDTSEQLARKATLFSLHKTLGIATFFVALLRIVWAITQTKPGPMHPEAKMEHWAAETVHWILYGSLVLVPLTGWIHHAATEGFAPIWWPFGQNLPFVPKSEALASLTAGLHFVLALLLAASVLAHIGGAMKHLVIDRDQTLQRMLPGLRALPKVAPHTWSSLPLVSALTIWGVVIGLGGMAGFYASHAAEPAQAELEAVVSDWEVLEGEIAIEVLQMGSTVRGTFADWTAQISFDPDVLQGKAGDVDVTIAVPSLTLGSVTGQALGKDFFDAETFPTARFQAEIVTIPDGHAALGTLTIKDQSVPVELPFTLLIEDDVASMQSQVTLQRLDFGIGSNMADESSLAFAVQVYVSVKAARAASPQE